MAKKRAVVLAAHTVNQGLHVAVEPDCQAAFENQRPRIGLDESTAAGGQHARGTFEQPCDHAPLSIAEVRLSESVEDFAHAHLRGFLDLVIRVGEGQGEQLGKLAADGGLADTHHAHKHQWPVDPGGQSADFAIAEGTGVDGHCRKRYRWANRRCKFGKGLAKIVAMGRKTIRLVLAVLLVLFLALAWYDGGREPQRLIEQPVDLPQAQQETGQ